MISRREVVEASSTLMLQPQVVEKDYVLGWLLGGIYNNEHLRGTWIFKGGTCLKKCYFETYRFSEDLDFTLTDPAHLNSDFLIATFSQVAAWIYERTGIEIPENQLRFDVYSNPRGNPACEGRLYYRGPLEPSGSLPRIKLDLTADEIVLKEPVDRPVSHPYSDAPAEGIFARCYPLDELFAEKLRALSERARPRDLYDDINLFRNSDSNEAAQEVHTLVEKKCAFRQIPMPSMEHLAERRDELSGDWTAMLQHQLPYLPPFETFWDELPALFQWLTQQTRAPAPETIPSDPGEVPVAPISRQLEPAVYGTNTLDMIRFSASNRLCVDLDYAGSTRRIEPYALRRSKDDRILLHAVKSATGEHRSYRLDRIQGARPTNQKFVPRYTVELTSGGASNHSPDGTHRKGIRLVPKSSKHPQERPSIHL